MYGSGRDMKVMGMDFTLPKSEVVVDLGRIQVEATVISQFYDKEPPALTVTDARGLPKDVSLEDFRGKWTLVEIWGFW